MVVEERPSPILLLEPDATLKTRIKRILTAASNLSHVNSVDDVLGLHSAIDRHKRLLIMPDTETDLALALAENRPALNVAIVSHDISLRVMEAAARPQVRHVISWPDFLAIPRAFDLAYAAKMTEPGASWTWRDMLPSCASHTRWLLYSSFDRDSVIERIGEIVREDLEGDRSADGIAEVAYEMAMNAMYDAPVDGNGQPKYSFDRHQDIALEDHEVPSLTLATDGLFVVLEVQDPFGRLTRSDVVEGLSRGMAARLATDGGEVLNTKSGGAGLGLFRMFQLATSLFFDVEPGIHTHVVAVFDLGLRTRDRRAYPTSLHLNFR